MTFEEYLISKKIDSQTYKLAESDQWHHFEVIFEKMHPKSFTMQKLNLINGIRRRFPLKEEISNKEEAKPKAARPVMRPKPLQSNVEEEKPAKPVVKPKVVSVKPKMGKPVMKSKTTATQDEVIKSKTKAKQIIKPKIPAKGKPKMVRPVIKPKSKN